MRPFRSRVWASFLLALSLACCQCGAPGLALADEVDVSPVVDRLETLTDYESSSEALTSDISQNVVEMKNDLSLVRDLQQEQLTELQGLRQDLASDASGADEVEGSGEDDVEPEPEVEVNEVETEPEVEGAEDEPHATLDDIARLLMVNIATTAMLLGVQVWRPLYDVLAGVR